MTTNIINIQQACKHCQICGKLRYTTKKRMMLLHENSGWEYLNVCATCYKAKINEPARAK